METPKEKDVGRFFQVGTANDKTCFVIMHNDDTSNAGLVIEILMRVFDKTEDEAVMAAVTAHMCGETYLAMWPKSVAQPKVDEAMRLASLWGCPDFSIELLESSGK